MSFPSLHLSLTPSFQRLDVQLYDRDYCWFLCSVISYKLIPRHDRHLLLPFQFRATPPMMRTASFCHEFSSSSSARTISYAVHWTCKQAGNFFFFHKFQAYLPAPCSLKKKPHKLQYRLGYDRVRTLVDRREPQSYIACSHTFSRSSLGIPVTVFCRSFNSSHLSLHTHFPTLASPSSPFPLSILFSSRPSSLISASPSPPTK